MEKRDFMIQRYCSASWPAIKGYVPFVATGPKFRAYTTSQAINYEWKFRSAFIDDLKSIPDDDLAPEVISELLLREGIVQALWSSDVDTCLPLDERWSASVRYLSEYFKIGQIVSSTLELLSGMSDPSFYKSYLGEDQLQLSPVEIPVE